jgi:hypothetical protein
MSKVLCSIFGHKEVLVFGPAQMSIQIESSITLIQQLHWNCSRCGNERPLTDAETAIQVDIYEQTYRQICERYDNAISKVHDQ